MTAKHEWPVGSHVFVVDRGFGRNTLTTYWAKVIKVGRKWVTVQKENAAWSIEKFDAETLQVDRGGRTSPARVYISEEEYTASTEAAKEWTELNRWMNYGLPPSHLTAADIREIRIRISGEDA